MAVQVMKTQEKLPPAVQTALKGGASLEQLRQASSMRVREAVEEIRQVESLLRTARAREFDGTERDRMLDEHIAGIARLEVRLSSAKSRRDAAIAEGESFRHVDVERAFLERSRQREEAQIALWAALDELESASWAQVKKITHVSSDRIQRDALARALLERLAQIVRSYDLLHGPVDCFSPAVQHRGSSTLAEIFGKPKSPEAA